MQSRGSISSSSSNGSNSGSSSSSSSSSSTNNGSNCNDNSTGTSTKSSTGNNWKIPQCEIDKRRDLREMCIFTIDPPTAKDLDDALHITELDANTVEIGVHIADVSYFVRPGSIIDEEAKKRATSVYLVQKVIPMLPSILCEELCSLNPNVDRLAYSCIWRMKLDGTLCNEKPWIGRTVIRCCAKIDYPTAQYMIDGIIPVQSDPAGFTGAGAGSNPSDPSDLSSGNSRYISKYWESHRIPINHTCERVIHDVILMNKVAMNRRNKRLDEGALVLNTTKLTFRLDNHGNPGMIAPYEIRDSNRLVEEYMLQANYLVAQECLERVGDYTILRNHPPPDIKNVNNLYNISNYLNLGLDLTNAVTMQRSLCRITATATMNVLQAVTSLLMTPMQLANYKVAGCIPSDDWDHFALGIHYYTHFTSPIRRYPDVMVHRLLEGGVEAALGKECIAMIENRYANTTTGSNTTTNTTDSTDSNNDSTGPRTAKDEYQELLEEITMHCNCRKKAAKLAQERSDRVFLAIHLTTRSPVVTDAIVIGIGPTTFTVLTVNQYGGINDKIFVRDMVGLESSYRDKTITLTNTYTNTNTGTNTGQLNNIGHSVTGSNNFNTNTNTNTNTYTNFEYEFDTVGITLMTHIRVLLMVKENSVPIDICMKFIGISDSD